MRKLKIIAITLLVSWCMYTIVMDAGASVEVVNANGDTCVYNVRSAVFTDMQICEGEHGTYTEARM